MKRIAALGFAGLLTFAMLGGCATKKDIVRLQTTQNQILQRLDKLEKSQADTARLAQEAAQKAQAASDQAQATATRCESMFTKTIKK